LKLKLGSQRRGGPNVQHEISIGVVLSAAARTRLRGVSNHLVLRAEAQVGVCMPLSQRTTDIRSGLAHSGPQVHCAHEDRSAYGVGVHQRGRIGWIKNVSGFDDVPVRIVNHAGLGVGKHCISCCLCCGEAGILLNARRSLSHQLVGRCLLSGSRWTARDRCHQHTVRH